jgi:hypothetical protein
LAAFVSFIASSGLAWISRLTSVSFCRAAATAALADSLAAAISGMSFPFKDP